MACFSFSMAVFLIACQPSSAPRWTDGAPHQRRCKGDSADSGAPGDTAPEPATEADFELLFSLNIDDWPLAGESIAAIDRALDLHEQYGVPVDIFLSDPMVQRIWRDAPRLLERLRSLPSVAVSYQFRAPTPYAQNFDWLGMDALEEGERLALLLDYEAHAIDLASGTPTPEPGGYQLLRDLLPYAPPGVGAGSLRNTVSRVFADKGAVFGISHDGTCDLGQTEESLYCRPEHVAVVLIDYLGEAACPAIEDAIAAAGLAGGDSGQAEAERRYVGIKWHDNDFFSSTSSWRAIYYDEAGTALSPPFDLSAAGQVEVFAPDRQQACWDLYEDALRCISSNPLRFHATHLLDVAALLEEVR